jgi:vancomycin permeability regulator SanA
VSEKNGIFSNANNLKSIQRNQKLFGEWKEYLSSFHLHFQSIWLCRHKDIEV